MLKHKSSVLKVVAFTGLFLACNEASFQGEPIRPAVKTSDAEAEVPNPPDEIPQKEPELPAETVDVPPPAPLPTPPTEETATIEESFIQQGQSGLVDIALVIDDSGSMTEEQANLSTKLNDLLVALKDADWQIGVVTTTVSSLAGQDRCRLSLIRSSDSDSEERFLRAVTPGVNGDGNEQGIRQAVNALKCRERPWVRPDSTVAVLIVSDEDNCSANGQDCPLSESRSEQFLINYVERDLKRQVGRNAGFYGIFAPPGEQCLTAGSVGNQYQKLVDYKASGTGNFGNICDKSYKTTLERISNNIAKLLGNQFTLKQSPIQNSLVVQAVKTNGDAISPADFTINGNVLTFKPGSEPALGSEISISYKVTITH